MKCPSCTSIEGKETQSQFHFIFLPPSVSTCCWFANSVHVPIFLVPLPTGSARLLEHQGGELIYAETFLELDSHLV